MTSIFVVKESSESYYENHYSNVAAFSSRYLAEQFAKNAQFLSDKRILLWNKYRAAMAEYINLNPTPKNNMPSKPKQKYYSNPKDFSEATKKYNEEYATAKSYKENYTANLLNAKSEIAKNLSNGELTWQEIEGFVHLSKSSFEVEEVTFISQL